MMRLPRPHRTGRVLAAACGLAVAACAGAQTEAPASEAERMDELRAGLERLEASVQALRRAFDAFAQKQAGSSAQMDEGAFPEAAEPPDVDLQLPAAVLVDESMSEARPDAEQVLGDNGSGLGEELGEDEEEPLRFVAADPPAAMMRQGREAFADNEFYAAEKKFREFLDRYPRHADALSVRYWLGETLYERGAYQEAIEEFREVLEGSSGPRRIVARLKTGYAWYELGEYEKASTALAQVQNEDPNGSLGRLAQLRLERLERKTGTE